MAIVILKPSEFANSVSEGICIYRDGGKPDGGRYKNLNESETALVHEIGCRVRTIRQWKSKTGNNRRYTIRYDEYFYCFIACILCTERGWIIADQNRISWLFNLLNCTSERVDEIPDPNLVKAILNDGKISDDKIERILQLTFGQPSSVPTKQKEGKK